MSEESTPAKQPFFTQKRIEITVAVLLALTAVLNAWASWIGTLHEGNQATNYTRSNHLASQGSSAYSAGMQAYLGDLVAWNSLTDYYFDRKEAIVKGDTAALTLINEKIHFFIQQNGSPILREAVDWMEKNDAISPFNMPGIADKYFATANELTADAQDKLDEGRTDNSRGDTYHLVNVLYSVVLFLLGIINIFKERASKATLLVMSIAGLVFTTAFMVSIPLPTGFKFSSFFTAFFNS